MNELLGAPEKSLEELVRAHMQAGGTMPLILSDQRFEGPQRLRGMTLPFGLDLQNTVFAAGLEVYECVFEKDLNASDTDFGGARADFSDSVFKALAVFRPRNASLLSLRSSILHNGFEVAVPRDHAMALDLRYVRIQGAATVKPMDYGQAGYQGAVVMSSIEASELTITKESSLELAGFSTTKLHLGEIVLQDKSSIYISDVQPKELYFNDIQQVDKANVAFNRVALAQARFSGSNVERYAFSNVNWPMQGQRASLMEESEWRAGHWFGREASGAELANAAEQITENYRQLVLNFESKRNYELAESFHTSEMEMLRHRAGNAWPERLGSVRFHLNAYGLYRALSGYGADYLRAARVLIMLLAIFSGAFMLTGIHQRNGGSFEYDLVFSDEHPPVTLGVVATDATRAFALTLSIVTLQKDRLFDPQGLAGTFLTSLLLLLAPAQAALLLFALRRRFRRASI